MPAYALQLFKRRTCVLIAAALFSIPFAHATSGGNAFHGGKIEFHFFNLEPGH